MESEPDWTGPFERLIRKIVSLKWDKQAQIMQLPNQESRYNLIREVELLTQMRDQVEWAYLKSYSPQELSLHRADLLRRNKVNHKVETLTLQHQRRTP